jgi:uncharacterized protein
MKDIPFKNKRRIYIMTRDLNSYKFSNYNHKISIEDDLYLYNALSGGFCRINDDAQEILDHCDLQSDVNEIANLPQETLDGLIEGSFLVDTDLDEFKLIKSLHIVNRFTNHNSLSLTLLPTTACNFRCSYCFEQDTEYPNKMMSEEVMDAIIKFIDEKLNDGGTLSITWFGGEPLVSLDILKKLQTRINELVDKKHLTLFAGIVTNGYLLTKEVSNELVDLRISLAQITIDGPKEVHDSKRFLANGKGSFDKIISNVLNMNNSLDATIRVNIDKDIINSVPKFMDFIIDSGIGDLTNVYFYFSIVRDNDIEKGGKSSLCYSMKDFSIEEIELFKLAYEKGINTGQRIRANLTSCASLSPIGFVIEPDGTLKKCYNTVGDEKAIVGHLLDKNINQSLVTKNQTEWYSWSQFDEGECKECSILPLCMGGCPYYTLNDKLTDLYKDSDYKCLTYKYNLEETLKLIAYKYLNEVAVSAD